MSSLYARSYRRRLCGIILVVQPYPGVSPATVAPHLHAVYNLVIQYASSKHGTVFAEGAAGCRHP